MIRMAPRYPSFDFGHQRMVLDLASVLLPVQMLAGVSVEINPMMQK